MGKVKKKESPLAFSLRSVYLREGKQWMSDDFDPMLPGQQLHGQFKASGHRVEVREAIENIPDAKPIRTCLITTKFQFRYLNTQTDKSPKDMDDDKYLVAEISTQIAVDYLIETSEAPAKEKLEHWASSNAVLHCWPYWREFCHSTLLRMNLPVIMMPMMVIENKKD